MDTLRKIKVLRLALILALVSCGQDGTNFENSSESASSKEVTISAIHLMDEKSFIEHERSKIREMDGFDILNTFTVSLSHFIKINDPSLDPVLVHQKAANIEDAFFDLVRDIRIQRVFSPNELMGRTFKVYEKGLFIYIK